VNSSQIYLVGGAIRDRLLGLEVTDKDWVVVGSSPQEMADQGFVPVGKDFPVFIDRDSGEEYALARTERKTAKGYQGFEFNTSPEVTLEQDLERRDLTINAMAEDEHGKLIDLHNGQADLAAGIIRHVSEAFSEDPVRVLRAARFAARFNFTIAPETMSLMRDIVVNGEADALVAERVWVEMRKALDTDAPHVFFQTLHDCGALARVLPEIEDLFGVPQTAKYHPEIDTGIHMMMVMEQVALITDDSEVRFSALMHDLGKAITPTDILPSHRGHEKAGLPLINQVCERLRVPKRFQSLALAVGEYHLHMFELKPQTVLNMLEQTRCTTDANRAKQFADSCLADVRGRTGFEDREYPQAQLFLDYQQAAAQVDGGQIAKGLNDGKAIQQAIRKARIDAIKIIKGNIKQANPDK